MLNVQYALTWPEGGFVHGEELADDRNDEGSFDVEHLDDLVGDGIIVQ